MYVASASTSVKFHDFPNGNVVHNYQPGTKIDGPIRSISWSKDGYWLALVPYSGYTEIISVKDQLKLVHTIQEVDEATCATFQNGTKRHIALGTSNGQVLIYDIKSRSVKKQFHKTNSAIKYVEFSAKDTQVVASSSKGEILVYGNVTNILHHICKIPKADSVSVMKANQTKKNALIAGSDEGIVAVWDLTYNKIKYTTQAHKAPVSAVAFSPVNPDLILTAGLDRQFCFYHTDERKQIACLPVENNITAADFSRDGINFVLASQNGKMYIFDSRRIQEPLHYFDAHKSTIKHLSFQKSEEQRQNSIINVEVFEEEATPKTIERADTVESSYRFSLDAASPDVRDVSKSPTSQETCDSFIAALGLDTSSGESPKPEVSSSLGLTDGVKKWMDSKSYFSETPQSGGLAIQAVTRSAKAFQSKLSSCDISAKQMSSTPNNLPQEVQADAAISPIVNLVQSDTKVSLVDEDTKEVFRRIVKEEMQVVKEELKDMILKEKEETMKEMKDWFFELKYEFQRMRLMIAGMQMVMVKGFVKQEDDLNLLRENLADDPNEEVIIQQRQLGNTAQHQNGFL